MALLEDLGDFDANAKIGDWAFTDEDTYIALRIGADPDRDFCILPIKPTPDGRAFWNWDGNREAPTLTPSILHWGNGRDEPATWHGYLRDGKLESV